MEILFTNSGGENAGNERIDKDEKRIAREERWEIIH